MDETLYCSFIQPYPTVIKVPEIVIWIHLSRAKPAVTSNEENNPDTFEYALQKGAISDKS